MESLSRQPDLDRLLYQSAVAPKSGGLEQTAAATDLTPEKADAAASEVQIKLVDKLQAATSPVEAASAGTGGGAAELDATSQLLAAEEAGAGALDIAQRRALLLGRTKQRHVCLQCGRECPSKHKLKRHLSTHSEQRPYNCHLCGKSFKWTEYLAKHMRTQHPGVEVPAYASTHGTSSSPSHSCLSPPPSSSSPSSSPVTTPSHSQPTPTSQPQTNRPETLTNSSASESVNVVSASLGSAPITNSPIGCDDTVYESNSHLGSSLTSSLQSHTSLLSEHTFHHEPSPLADDLLQPPPVSQNQVKQASGTPQQASPLQPRTPTQQQMLQQQRSPVAAQPDVLQHLHKQQQQQQQQEHSEKQKLLQQQIQRHQLQQQQRMQSSAQLSHQVLQQQQPQGLQQQLLQQQQQQQNQPQGTQPHQLQQSLVQSAQELLQQTSPAELQSPHSLPGQLLTDQQHMQFVTTTTSPQSTSVVSGDSPAQMGGAGGGALQVPHPLAHVMNSEAVVQGMGYVDHTPEGYDPTVSSSGVVYSTDVAYQDSANSFTSQVYNSQGDTQVYQMSSQAQQTMAHQESFTETFSPSSGGDSGNYGSALTSLPLSQGQPSSQQGLDPNTSYSLAQQQQHTVVGQQGGGGGEGGMVSMDGLGVQTQDANILHMQAQITQSAYELQSVQMDTSMQSYDTSGMMQQPVTTYQDGSTGGYQDAANTYQEDANAAYQTGPNAYQIQPGYQDAGVSYQDPRGQPASNAYTETSSLDIDPSRQIYQTSVNTQGTTDPQHVYVPTNSDMSSAEVVQYGQQISLSEGVYGTLTTDTFQQTALPPSDSGGGMSGAALQPHAAVVEKAELLLRTQHVPQTLGETTTLPPPDESTAPLTQSTTENSSTGNTAAEKAKKKSQKPKESVGIQCEVGPETFRALKEEEANQKLITSSASAGSRGGNSTDSSGTNDATSQKVVAPSSSLLLANSGSSPVNDSLKVSSPGAHTSSGENVSFTSQSDKVIRKYPCELTTCGKAYVHRKDLIRHMTLSHGMSPQKLEPVVIETPEKPYTCQVGVCRKSYFHQKDLRRHQRQCHSVSDTNLSGAVEMTDADGKVMVRFPCDFPGCQRSYVHKKDLVRHKRVYHKDESKKPSIPVPVKFTEADLKRIRHEEKSFHEKEGPLKKPRLDSTGSAMSSGEDQSQGVEVSAAVVPLSEVCGVSPGPSTPAGGVGVVDQGQIVRGSGELSSLQEGELQEITQVDQTQLTEVQQLGLSLPQQVEPEQPTQLGVTLPRVIPQPSPPPQGTHHLPTILRRQRHGGSNPPPSAPPTPQDQQQQVNELALRNLASLMLGVGGLHGAVTSGSGPSFDPAQTTISAFSASPLVVAIDDDPVTSQGNDVQQSVAQFDTAAIISALSSVVNNPDVLGSTGSAPLDQHQVVSVESVANALQFLTSTSNNT